MSNETVVQQLNRNLPLVLAGINQSFLHARILKNQGLDELGEKFYKRSIVLMKEADAVIERILLLHGMPNLQDMGKVSSGSNIEGMVACDLDLENRRHTALEQAMAACEQEQDYVSRVLLVGLMDENEEYMDWLETQQELIAEMGLPNYVQSAMEND